jgi:hypothetical protein
MEDGLQERIDIIEETYEFMLAYAAQGLSGNEAGGPGAQMRDFLERCNGALEGLSTVLKALVEAKQLEPAEHYHAFIEIVEQDVRNTQTAIQLVLAQHSVSSQLIDNLNAWIHLRALLTDLFVIDEILRGT